LSPLSGVDHIASNGMMKELESGSAVVFPCKANGGLWHADVDGQRRRERFPVNGIHQYLKTPGTLQVAIGEHDLLSVKTGLHRLDFGLDPWYLQHIPPHWAARDEKPNNQRPFCSGMVFHSLDWDLT
jgi:hypothetical protein